MALPSTASASAALTSVAGCATIAPLSATRPASIRRSESRREATPARARNLAMRSFSNAKTARRVKSLSDLEFDSDYSKCHDAEPRLRAFHLQFAASAILLNGRQRHALLTSL